MFVFRSIALGLLGACFLLLATRHDQLRIERVPVAAATIIDVAPGVEPERIAELVRLQPDEHVISVDDQVRFVDITVSSPRGERRVLVLRH